MTIKTKICFGRAVTKDEKEELVNKIAVEVATGNTDGKQIEENPWDNYLRTIIRTWNNLESANNWASFCNNFDPAPVSAEVIED